MAKLERVEHKVFASEAPLDEMGQFGSALDTTLVNTKDIVKIQSLPAYTKGWGSAVVSSNNYPTMEEMNGVLNVMSYQTGYLYQEGIPVWYSKQEYSASSIVKGSGGQKLYRSLKDNNLNHSLNDETWWKELELGGNGVKIGTVLTGIIDETENKERYLNGGLIVQDQFVSFTKWIKKVVALYPSLNTTEENWQAELTMSAKGQCGKFVIDDNAGTIRLPKVVNIQGLFDLSQAGVTKEAGLPNITGKPTTSAIFNNFRNQQGKNGAFTTTFKGNMNLASGGGTQGLYGFEFDASDSNPIYGNSTTVQEEAVQYPYYIVVATGSKDSIDVIREAELNNPFTFGMYIYTQSILNNIAWLRSNGQYNSGDVFTDFYDWLLKIKNGTAPVEGVSVKNNDEPYTDYDYVIVPSDRTFRLPIKVKGASGGKSVVKAGEPHEFTSMTTENYVTFSDNTNKPITNSNQYLGINNQGKMGTTGAHNQSGNFGIRFDNLYIDLSNSTDDGLYLYFYVGETVQNVNLINAGRIEEKLASQINIIKTYVNGTSGYNIYSNGYCEQWGRVTGGMDTVITFLRHFKDTNYSVEISEVNTPMRQDWTNANSIKNLTISSMTMDVALNTATVCWQVKGYLAEGEY